LINIAESAVTSVFERSALRLTERNDFCYAVKRMNILPGVSTVK
jgi:hypothetical protein